MKAVVLKCHHGYTSDQAYFVRKAVPEIGVYGGVVLNNSVGGINPFAAGPQARESIFQINGVV